SDRGFLQACHGHAREGRSVSQHVERDGGSVHLIMRRSSCFSLVELVVVMVLIGFLSALGSKMIAGTMQTSYIAARNHSSGSEPRYAMERVTREIREMAFAASGYSVTTMGASSIVFTKEDGTT